MGAELLFILFALTPIAVGAGLLGTGDAETPDEFGADPARADAADISDLIPDLPEDTLPLPGGGGDDVVVGTDADESAFTDRGADSVSAGGGADYIRAGGDADTVAGEAGDDVLFGEAGADLLLGGEGDDTLVGGADADSLEGGEGADVLFATDAGAEDDAADTLDGGAGNDLLFFGPADIATGGAGADAFVAAGAATVTDFDSTEDMLVVRYTGEEAPEIAAQTVTATGVELRLSDGTVITLDGLTEPVDASRIAFLEDMAL
ncbi:Hemolysin-type calcium-binding repeat-containing protein [Roseivivax lentus]|uniref:Hemolysin-type calcium-binding repeat-containing protein n=1 Tax=Roseivivax lentus TaxID=633194 RepID=A0A1N7PJN9_9RHOB|nr:hypothetical protein [Roseivivax lentus]SIT10727.1 Hemolysin-type calcium-binding repeat-containing protein [Roseivivax lentus]